MLCFRIRLILRMHLSVHKEFHFIKLIHLGIVWVFHSMTSTKPWSSLRHQPLFLSPFCSFSLPQVKGWLKQLLIDHSQALGLDREKLVCVCCVIYLSGTCPAVELLALLSRLRKNMATCLNGKRGVQSSYASDTKSTFIFQLQGSICCRKLTNCQLFCFK